MLFYSLVSKQPFHGEGAVKASRLRLPSLR